MASRPSNAAFLLRSHILARHRWKQQTSALEISGLTWFRDATKRLVAAASLSGLIPAVSPILQTTVQVPKRAWTLTFAALGLTTLISPCSRERTSANRWE